MSSFAPIEPIWSSDLGLGDEPKVDWIWQGYIAPGNVTLFTGLWKSGKTTLLAMLLARRNPAFKPAGEVSPMRSEPERAGEGSELSESSSTPKLAGLTVKPGKTLVISEESLDLWARRFRRYNMGNNVCVISRPFNCIPSEDQWHSLLDQVRTMRKRDGIDLLVIDPLSLFLPQENNAKCVLDYLIPLCNLTKTGLAITATHHPAKEERALGQSARGSGAISAQVDIVLEMRLPASDYLTRRRRLIGLSRHTETPRHLLLELNADATDYIVLPDEPEDGFDAHWHILELILENAGAVLSRREIHARWPEDQPRPALNTLRDWLTAAVQRNLVNREGTGHRSNPYRYSLPKDSDDEAA
jgi:hypothetical protein